jgi:hypothetical protein
VTDVELNHDVYKLARRVLNIHERNKRQGVWLSQAGDIETARCMIDCGLLFLNDEDEEGSIAVIPGTICRPKAGRTTDLDDQVVIEDTYQATRRSVMAARKTAKKAATKKATTAKEAKPKRERKPKKEPTACLCGCGEMCARYFKMGHDARLAGFMSRMIKGKATPDEIKRAKAAVKHEVVQNSPKFSRLMKDAGLS